MTTPPPTPTSSTKNSPRGAHLIVADDIAIRRGGSDVITQATFALGPGLWWLRGANGSGKSTLLRALAGVGPTWRGTIRIAGHDLVADPVAARNALGYAPQSAELMGYLSVREFLETVAALRGAPPDPALALAQRWIHAACAPQRIDTLSAGQRRKLCLCAALCAQPRVLLLDEPETGLDVGAAADLRTRLATLAADGHAVLIASHTDRWFTDLRADQGPASDRLAIGQLRVAGGKVHGPQP